MDVLGTPIFGPFAIAGERLRSTVLVTLDVHRWITMGAIKSFRIVLAFKTTQDRVTLKLEKDHAVLTVVRLDGSFMR